MLFNEICCLFLLKKKTLAHNICSDLIIYLIANYLLFIKLRKCDIIIYLGIGQCKM